jgi:hypothetical protein
LDTSVLEILGIGNEDELETFVESYRELFSEEINSDLFS